MTNTPQDATELLPASLFKRLLAFIYDLLILIAVSWAYSALATALMVLFGGDDQGDYLPMQRGHWFEVGWILTIVAFYWYFWMRAGQTVGMRAWRLKVVSQNGEALSHHQCLLRILVAPISVAVFGMGYWWCLFNRRHAAWHDLASGTRVVQIPKPHKK